MSEYIIIGQSYNTNDVRKSNLLVLLVYMIPFLGGGIAYCSVGVEVGIFYAWTARVNVWKIATEHC